MVETRKCPFCGGRMVPSKVETYGHSTYFWVPPWKSKTTGIFTKAVYGRVWLCLDCGALIPYVNRTKLSILREEFEVLRTEGKV
ncbi:hypothetical protein [Thermococcus sp.]|uniref:hypothetical protein n=1 Tax=Thermococcus sp. TaxID=35749 RepID=UPI00260E28CE|nr:hypothetical protein [Thermococcus sp.]